MLSGPGPLYRSDAVGLNVMPYISGAILQASPEALAAVQGPAWFAVTPGEAASLMRGAPQNVHEVLSFGSDKEWRLLRKDL